MGDGRRVGGSDLDLDVFWDPLFAEARTGAFADILILGDVRPRSRTAGVAGDEPGGKGAPRGSATVRLSPDAKLVFPSAAEAERFMTGLAALCDQFGHDCQWQRGDATTKDATE